MPMKIMRGRQYYKLIIYIEGIVIDGQLAVCYQTKL